MVSCSSGGEQQPTDPDMDPTVAQDDSVYKEESGDASEETASADNSLEAGLALIEGATAVLVTKMIQSYWTKL